MLPVYKVLVWYLKIFLVTLFITKNYNNKIAVGKVVNTLMRIIHKIEVDANKVKNGTMEKQTTLTWKL